MKTRRTIKSDEYRGRRIFLVGWLTDLRDTLTAPSGWVFAGKALVLVGGAYGILIALQGYQSQVRNAQIDQAERSFLRLLDDFTSTSEQVRVGALARAPAVMMRHVPISTRVSAVEAIKAILFGTVESDCPYSPEVKRLIHAFADRGPLIRNGSDTTELPEAAEAEPNPALQDPSPTDSILSARETDAFVDMLVSLGPDGWYKGEPRHYSGKREEGLAWLWNTSSSPLRNKYDATATLFEHAHFASLDLARFKLQKASFRLTSAPHARLMYADLEGAMFEDGVFDYADFSHAKLPEATLARASLLHADFSDAMLSDADFRGCDLRGASFRDAKLAGARLIGARMDQTNLSNADSQNQGGAISGALFQDSSLKGARMVDAKLQESNLERTTLDDALLDNAILDDSTLAFASARNASFAFVSFKNVVLSMADLSGASFDGAKNLDSIKDCFDTNIAGISGLDQRIADMWVQKGAVIIPDPKQWQAYKAAGRPHQRWRAYAP